jgi:uncharacterized protein
LFKTEYAPLQDGIKLAVDVYQAEDTKSLPVILELTPYGRGPEGFNFRSEADKWYENGYRFVIADARGTGDSQGDFEFLTSDGKDGAHLIEWIAKQRWSNSRVAMRGSSYSGTNQWYIAAQQPPSLKCINPSATLGSPLEQPPYRNGAFSLNWVLNWFSKSLNSKERNLKWNNSEPSNWLTHRPLREIDVFATGKKLTFYRKFLDMKLTDPYWKLFELSESEYARLNIPSLAFTGWFDSTLYGTIMRFEKARSLSMRKKDQFLVVGPYTHTNAPDGGYDYLTGEPVKNVGDLVFGDNAFVPAFELTREFYDWCLKNATRPKWHQSRIYLTQSDYWIGGDKFSPDNLKSTYLYLHERGRLDWVAPASVTSDFYVYNPSDPVRSDAVKNIDEPVDIGFYLNRSDVLVFTSNALTKPFSVIGEVNIELTVSSSARDTDFVVFLMDVDEQDRSVRLGSMSVSLVRMRYRNGFENESLLKTDQRYNVRINIREIGHTFLAGHRIRLAITSSFYPFISANPNTGNPIATDTAEPVRALQRVHFGPSDLGVLSRIHFKQLY